MSQSVAPVVTASARRHLIFLEVFHIPAPSGERTSRGLVTGAASGIGRATALRLAAESLALTLIDQDDAALAIVGAQAEKAGVEVLRVTCDVSTFDAVSDAASAARQAFGPLTKVVACAGVEVLGTVLDLSLDDWKRALDVNLSGVFNVAKATLPQLVETSGALVAIASDAGVTGAQGYSAYAASKHGVVGLIRCLALDFGPAGVRANAVAPSFVDTPMTHRIFTVSGDEERDFYARAVPLGRFATPDEIAAVVSHLLSEESSFTNGSVYAVDGGSTAGYFRAR